MHGSRVSYSFRKFNRDLINIMTLTIINLPKLVGVWDSFLCTNSFYFIYLIQFFRVIWQ